MGRHKDSGVENTLVPRFKESISRISMERLFLLTMFILSILQNKTWFYDAHIQLFWSAVALLKFIPRFWVRRSQGTFLIATLFHAHFSILFSVRADAGLMIHTTCLFFVSQLYLSYIIASTLHIVIISCNASRPSIIINDVRCSHTIIRIYIWTHMQHVRCTMHEIINI